METVTYTFPSLTQSMKIETLLHENNIPSRVVKIDKNLTKSGCKFGITFNANYERSVKAILKNNRIYAKHRLVDYNGETV